MVPRSLGEYISYKINLRAMRLMSGNLLTAKVPAPMASTALDPAACNIRMHMRTAIDFETPPTADPMVKI